MRVGKERIWKNSEEDEILSVDTNTLWLLEGQVLKTGGVHTAFRQRSWRQQTHRKERLQGECRLTRPQEISQWFFVVPKEPGSSWVLLEPRRLEVSEAAQCFSGNLWKCDGWTRSLHSVSLCYLRTVSWGWWGESTRLDNIKFPASQRTGH